MWRSLIRKGGMGSKSKQEDHSKAGRDSNGKPVPENWERALIVG